MAGNPAICGYCGAPLREVVNGACAFCRTPVTTAAGPVSAGSGYAVLLQPAGRKKINVIKAVRVQTGLDLAGAKNLVESADAGPAVIARGLPFADAQAYVAEISKAGGQAEVTAG